MGAAGAVWDCSASRQHTLLKRRMLHCLSAVLNMAGCRRGGWRCLDLQCQASTHPTQAQDAALPLCSSFLSAALKVVAQWQGRLEELERELLEVNGNAERLARSFSELVELQLVLEKASAFFDDAQHRASTATFQAQPADTGSESLVQAPPAFTRIAPLGPATERSTAAAGIRRSMSRALMS